MIFSTGKIRRDFERAAKLQKKLAIKMIEKRPSRRPGRQDIAVEYIALRKKAFCAIARRFIIDEQGRRLYEQTGSAYQVAGAYRIHPDFIDWDHRLRDLNEQPAGIARNRTLKKLLARLEKKK